MPNTFIREQAELTTTLADIYTPGAGVSAVIFSIIVDNIDTATNAQADVTIELEDTDAGATFTDLATEVPVPFASPWSLGEKVVLNEGESLRAKASANTNFVIQLSILEVT